MRKTLKGWWHNASNEQRLAQIDGGIECGMTGKQVAMNCGAIRGGGAVIVFANRHGRGFGPSNYNSRNQRNAARVTFRIYQAKVSGRLTDHHFNIFALDEVVENASEFEELDFQS